MGYFLNARIVEAMFCGTGKKNGLDIMHAGGFTLIHVIPACKNERLLHLFLNYIN